MSKRPQKKLKKLRSSHEQTPNNATLAIQSQQHQNINKIRIETPHEDADQHIFSFTPCNGAVVSNPSEFRQSGVPNENAHNFRSISPKNLPLKKQRQKQSATLKVSALSSLQPISQQIDAPAIINNILNTPVQKLGHYGSQPTYSKQLQNISSSKTTNTGLPPVIQVEPSTSIKQRYKNEQSSIQQKSTSPNKPSLSDHLLQAHKQSNSVTTQVAKKIAINQEGSPYTRPFYVSQQSSTIPLFADQNQSSQ